MQGHLQILVNQGFMTVMEHAAYHMPVDPSFSMPVDPSFSMPVDGYVVIFVAFYEWGFGAPSHRFLLHIAAFMTLCEAYVGIDPELGMWNYFFRVQSP
jgi:hypothetical protein